MDERDPEPAHIAVYFWNPYRMRISLVGFSRSLLFLYVDFIPVI
jgi:hypothetical protein